MLQLKMILTLFMVLYLITKEKLPDWVLK